MSNPVFGKPLFLEKEKTGPKERRSKTRNDKTGTKRLSLATILEKNLESEEPNVYLSSVNKPALAVFTRFCLFCHGSHHLNDCSDFAKVSNQDCIDFIMKKRLCFACLRVGHQSRGCNKKKTCIHVVDDTPPSCMFSTSVTNTHSQISKLLLTHTLAKVSPRTVLVQAAPSRKTPSISVASPS